MASGIVESSPWVMGCSVGKDSRDYLALPIPPSSLISNPVPFLPLAAVNYYVAINSPWEFYGVLKLALKGWEAHLLRKRFPKPLLAL